MQYVKSIRYFLPIYPYLVMSAAYLVVSFVGLGSRAALGSQG